MTRLPYGFPLAALATGLLCHTACAGELSTDRAAIQAEYFAMNTDFAHHDLPGVMQYFTSDYVDVDTEGKTTDREQAQHKIKDQLSQMTSMQTHYTLVTCTAVPAGVEIELRAHTDGTGKKKILFAHVHGSFTNDLWVRDLWIDTPEGWRIKHRLTFEDNTHTSI